MANKRKSSWKKDGLHTVKIQKGNARAEQFKKEPENVDHSGKEDDEEDELALVADASGNAYNALLSSLQANGGSFVKSYAQRQKKEQGGSSNKSVAYEGYEEERRGEHSKFQERCLDGEEDDGKIFQSNSNVDLLFNEEQEGLPSEESDVASTRDLSKGTFKHHMEHSITEEERKKLLKTKFFFGAIAVGIQGAKWVTSASDFPKVDKRLDTYGLKLKIKNYWKHIQVGAKYGDFVNEQQCQFFSMCNSYQDILHSRKPFLDGSLKAEEEDRSFMDAYTIHILNHVIKTRDLITKNNEKLQEHMDAGLSHEENLDPPRDQGFTRPKALILLPLRSTALKFVNRLLEVAPPSQKFSVEHKERFFDDFGVEENDNEELLSQSQSHKNVGQSKEKASKGAKPTDFRVLFGGNNDDHFCLGIKLTRKSIKLYNDFYTSDIIVASPIALITRIGESENQKDTDVDFLSSIEITVIDYANVLLMQNWSHVVTVFEHLNRIPAQGHGTDFMRIREWYLNGHGRYYRQTIILAPFPDAGINALFLRACVNYAGKIKLQTEYSGTLSRVLLQVRQVYERLECNSITEVDDSRFDFFVKQVFARIKDSLKGGIMVFMRSYFDFVRLRNFLKEQNASFCLLGEYTKQNDVSRARAWFFHGKRKIILYTERAHFYHRYQVRGIKEVVFYSLPDHAHFYAEIMNMLEGVENPSCTVLFSRFDKLQLERIVGSSRAEKMLKSKNRTFMFC